MLRNVYDNACFSLDVSYDSEHQHFILGEAEGIPQAWHTTRLDFDAETFRRFVGGLIQNGKVVIMGGVW